VTSGGIFTPNRLASYAVQLGERRERVTRQTQRKAEGGEHGFDFHDCVVSVVDWIADFIDVLFLFAG